MTEQQQQGRTANSTSWRSDLLSSLQASEMSLYQQSHDDSVLCFGFSPPLVCHVIGSVTNRLAMQAECIGHRDVDTQKQALNFVMLFTPPPSPAQSVLKLQAVQLGGAAEAALHMVCTHCQQQPAWMGSSSSNTRAAKSFVCCACTRGGPLPTYSEHSSNAPALTQH